MKEKRDHLFTSRAIECISSQLEEEEHVVAVVSQARRRPYVGAVSAAAGAVATYDVSFVATDRRLFTIKLSFLVGRPVRVTRIVPLGAGCEANWHPEDKVWQELDMTLEGKEHAYRVHRNREYQLPPFVAAVSGRP